MLAAAAMSQCVRVAVIKRPLNTTELLHGCMDCIVVPPNEPQVQIGSHTFTYDYVYGSTGSPSTAIYDDCVAPLIDGVFHGYNATVFAYGQTYTMGTNYTGEESGSGVIPKVMETIFKKVQGMKESTEFVIRVSFIEIFKEEIFDLLDPNSSRVPIHIRESLNGGITLAGVTEPEVKTKEEMSSYLTRGSLSRATGSTNMSSQSSRSHAIFTITMEQKNGNDVLCAKLHLVDLAGSERAKRTGADGMRLKEGGAQLQKMKTQIEQLQAELLFFRDDSGGPFEELQILKHKVSLLEASNAELQHELQEERETCESLKQRACDAHKMQTQIEQLHAELLFFRGGPFEELQILKHKVSLLEASNAELKMLPKRRKPPLVLHIRQSKSTES